jgi:hypothetical protein
MAAARELLGYVMGAIFASVAVMMMGMAWLGLDKAIGWQLALVVLVVSLTIRVNIFVLLGAYLFAAHHWGFSSMNAAVFMLPGFMFVTPGVAITLFGAISRPQSHY